MTVDITFRFKLKSEIADQYCSDLPPILVDTAAREGFESIRVVRSNDDPSHILMIERWRTLEDYENYIAWRTGRGDLDDFIAQLDGEPVLEVWPSLVADLKPPSAS